MALFFNGQCRLANTFLAKLLGVKFSLTVTWKTWKIKFNGRGWSPHGHVILHFLPLIDHNSLLVYYRFEYKGNFYQYGLYYTWVQMLLQIRPLLRLGSKCYYGSDFYYAWVQMLSQMGPLLHLGPVSTLVPSTTSLQQTPRGQKILDGWIFCPSGQKKGAVDRVKRSGGGPTEYLLSHSKYKLSHAF